MAPVPSKEGVQNDDVNRKCVAVHWHRHGLRLHDNPALLAALEGADTLYPIFIFDGDVAGTGTAAYTRMAFTLECLEDLDKSYQKHGMRLFTFRGKPKDIFTMLIEEWDVTRVTFEQDPEPIWRERDDGVKALCEANGVECVEVVSHTLWDPKEVIEMNGGNPPHTYKLFNQVVSTLGSPPRPVAYPDFSRINTEIPNDFEEKFALPSIKELGSEPESDAQRDPPFKWIGGEKKALELLSHRLNTEEDAYKAGYIMPNQYKPDLVGAPNSMSPHLRFGCLSIRRFYWEIHDLFAKVHGDEMVPTNLTAQLIWREFFYCMSHNNINYNKMDNNPICLKIPWYNDEEKLEKWSTGQTGFPWIDACMRQLHVEGWVHHVARHAVACFLTRGDLWISWEEGLKVFDKYLLDGDWSVCAGNWMWVSSSAFENCLQCPNCFSPVMYGMRMDPTGEFVRRYVPELKAMPLKFLFQPWKAPQKVQEKTRCIIGKDYPKPMVDHRTAAADCKRKMEEVKAILKDPNLLHCAPSDMEEVRQFCWLPDHMATGGACTANTLCEGIEGL